MESNVPALSSRSDCNLNWMTRVPSPFPAGVVEHLPPDGRLHHQRRVAETIPETANVMNYPVQQPKVLMTRTKVETMGDQRRAPPPPPPRGVTLRSPSAVVAPSGAFGTARPPPSVATSTGTSAVNRLHFKTANAVAPNAIAPSTKPVMKEHVAAELSAAHHPQGYLETRYAYSVNGILGSAAQASAAAAFFARASQKLNLASPQRRKRHGSSDGAESPIPAAVHRFGTDFSGLLRRNPPPPPPHLLRRLGLRENPGVGKVRVMLRVAGDPTTSNFLSVDKKRKQLTLQEPGNHSSLTLASSSSSEKEHQVGAEDRRVGVAAPKMFAFDGLFTAADNSQGDVAASVLSDIVTAVINGSDGCVFCFGHAQLGKTTTMVGSCSEDIGPGLMPTAIAWLFRGIGEQKNKTGARFSVRVSAVEIAGPAEVLRDLLAPHATESEESPGVYLRDDPLLGTQLQNQSELRAPTAEKAAFYLDAALAARTDASSPDARFSHLLYTLHVYQYSVDRNASRTGSSGHATGGSAGSGVAGGRSRLHLLDLGSCQQTGRPTGNGQSSANNMTLSGLGNVLVALFNGQRHLPHREHKITQVLRECLGSLTCQAALVAHVAASSSYSETLSTVQMASRVHRMRRRRMKYNNAGSGGSGSGGSSEDSSRLGLSRSSGGESSTGGSADPSSSEQSCDTVIYVGPIDDATDGEHPPVYLPSLNSGDHRCSMSRALRGSTVDRPVGQQQSSRSPVHHVKKESPTPVAPSRSPQIQRKVAKCEPIQQSSKQSNSVAGSSNEEQWIDGPRFNKTRISQARMQVVRHQREMWVDGPPTDPGQVLPTPVVLPTVTPTVNQAPLGYGFMDQHKQGMIRQWVENQSVQQRHPPVRTNGQMWIDAQPRPAPEPGTPVKVLTVFKTCPDDEDESKEVDNATPAENTRSPRVNRHPVPVKQSRRKAEPSLKEEVPISSNPKQPPEEKLNCLSGVGGVNIESVEPTASSLTLEQLYSQCEQLADSLVQEEEEEHVAVEDSSTDGASDDLSAALDVTSEQVSISCDSWRRVRHRDEDDNTTVTEFKVCEVANQRGRHDPPMHGRGGDYSPEYIEVEEPDEPVPTQDSCLQVTEEDIAFSMMEALEAKCNDTRSLSSFGDGEEHPLRALSHDNLTIISHFTGETYSQGTACEWEPIGSSIFDPMPSSSAMENAEFYQNQLEQLAKLHQQIYQQSVAGNTAGTLHPTPLSALTNCNIGSFKDLPLLTQDWNNVTVRTSPGRNGLGQETRKAMVSTIGMELERELGIQDANQAALLSSLRHPDGASDPHLDQHSGKAYESSRSCEVQQEQQERLPGNGASNSDPEEEMAIKSNAMNTTATLANLIPERECKSFNEENSVEHEKVIHHKTPKLSRFFSGSKSKQQSSSVTKRNTATSTAASPIPTPKAMSSAKASPKVEKRSKSRENTSKHNSPAKSLSKSPSRIDPATSVSVPPSPKSQSSKSSNKKDKLKASSSHKSPKKDLKINWDGKSSGSKRDVKSYGFSYESCHQTAPSSLCPSEGYESGGSDSGVHLSAASPIKSRRHAQQIQQQQQIRRQHLMPIGEMSRKNFSSGTSTSGSGGSGGSAGHYESSGYESVIRDSECSSLGSSSQDSDREALPLALAISTGKQPATIGQSSSCTIL